MSLEAKIRKVDPTIRVVCKKAGEIGYYQVSIDGQTLNLLNYYFGRYVIQDGSVLFSETADYIQKNVSELKQEPNVLWSPKGSVIWGLACQISSESVAKLSGKSDKKEKIFYSYRWRKCNNLVCVLNSAKTEDLVAAIKKFVQILNQSIELNKKIVQKLATNHEIYDQYLDRITQNAQEQNCPKDNQGNYVFSIAQYNSNKKVADKGIRSWHLKNFVNVTTPILFFCLFVLWIPRYLMKIMPQYSIKIFSFQLAFLLTLLLYEINKKVEQARNRKFRIKKVKNNYKVVKSERKDIKDQKNSKNKKDRR